MPAIRLINTVAFLPLSVGIKTTWQQLCLWTGAHQWRKTLLQPAPHEKPGAAPSLLQAASSAGTTRLLWMPAAPAYVHLRRLCRTAALSHIPRHAEEWFNSNPNPNLLALPGIAGLSLGTCEGGWLEACVEEPSLLLWHSCGRAHNYIWICSAFSFSNICPFCFCEPSIVLFPHQISLFLSLVALGFCSCIEPGRPEHENWRQSTTQKGQRVLSRHHKPLKTSFVY